MAAFKLSVNKDEILKLIDEKLDEIADEIFANSQQNIVDKQIVDEGTLLKSGNINRSFLNKTIIYNTPYADSIEYGRLPGSMPPVESIKGWVKRKGIANDEKDINRISWAIAQDIKKNGTEPRPFLEPAVEKVKNDRRI
jgi:hypothetical protein